MVTAQDELSAFASTSYYIQSSSQLATQSFLVQLTTTSSPPNDPSKHSVTSRMIWVGTADRDGQPASRRLGSDWACAMPSKMASAPVAGATLLSSSSSAAGGPGTNQRAVNMAQRLARRFNQQIFLSLDLPSDFAGGSAAAMSDPYTAKALLSLEGELVKILKAAEAEEGKSV